MFAALNVVDLERPPEVIPSQAGLHFSITGWVTAEKLVTSGAKKAIMYRWVVEGGKNSQEFARTHEWMLIGW